MPRNEAHVVRINVFNYANNVRFVSLNIMFLTTCKYSIFRARVSAALYEVHLVLFFTTTAVRGAGLSELNVK